MLRRRAVPKDASAPLRPVSAQPAYWKIRFPVSWSKLLYCFLIAQKLGPAASLEAFWHYLCHEIRGRGDEKERKQMRRQLLMLATALACFAGGSQAFAEARGSGQYPAAPATAEQLALPECGFAATESWGPNGLQYCDPDNVYPKPQSSVESDQDDGYSR